MLHSSIVLCRFLRRQSSAR